MLEESRFVSLAEARAQIRLQAGLEREEAVEPAVSALFSAAAGLEDHRWLAYRAAELRGPARPCPARRRFRVLLAGGRACGQGEVAALLTARTATDSRVFYQGRLRTTVCRVLRAGDELELKIIEYPAMEDQLQAWLSLERSLQRALRLTIRRRADKRTQSRPATAAETDCNVG